VCTFTFAAVVNQSRPSKRRKLDVMMMGRNGGCNGSGLFEHFTGFWRAYGCIKRNFALCISVMLLVAFISCQNASIPACNWAVDWILTAFDWQRF